MSVSQLKVKGSHGTFRIIAKIHLKVWIDSIPYFEQLEKCDTSFCKMHL